MRTFDLTPLYRSSVGFDRLASLMDDVLNTDTTPNYPPYNIELVADDHYRITLAVAGFAESELDIVSQRDTLVVTGKKSATDSESRFLHQGIAGRDFERRFRLADYVLVKGAVLKNGLLSIELMREVPEAHKPKTIRIDSGRDSGLNNSQAA